MKPPFHLIQNKISGHTVSALRQLLSEAESGEIIGMAFIAMYRNREFVVDTTGESRRNPVFTRGMLSYLDDELSSKMDK